MLSCHHFCCRPTFSSSKLVAASHEGAREFIEALSGQTLGTLKSAFGQVSVEEMVRKAIIGVGSPIIGTPEQVAEALGRLHQAGVDGVLLTFRHVREELEEFIEKVVPRLEQLGVRQSQRTRQQREEVTYARHE